MPFVIGSNAAEYAWRFETVTTELAFRALVAQMIGAGYVNAVLQMYAVSEPAFDVSDVPRHVSSAGTFRRTGTETVRAAPS